MKLHSIVDCITNSSSTTFIISFQEIPETWEEMQKLLFPNNEQMVDGDYGISQSTEIIAKILLEKIQNREEIKTSKEFFDNFPEEDNHKDWWNRYRDSHIFQFIFHDGEDDGIVLQSEKIYKNLPYIVVF